MSHLVSTGLLIARGARIRIPPKVTAILQEILEYLPDPGLEYGFFLKGKWLPEKATVEVATAEFFLPRQRVGPAHIQFLEDAPSTDFNVVVHRHPHGCRRFSATDENSINEEFLASLLFMPPYEFPDAIVNVPIAPGTKLQVRATVEHSSAGGGSALAALVAEKIETMRMPRIGDGVAGGATSRASAVLGGRNARETGLDGLHPDDIPDILGMAAGAFGTPEYGTRRGALPRLPAATAKNSVSRHKGG
jgi:hypothetical protein